MSTVLTAPLSRTLTDLVEAARTSDEGAWEEIVHRLGNLVWSITRSYGIPRHDAVDVSQTVWLQLARRLDSISEPERLGLWLATTTRRECIRYIQHHGTSSALPSESLEDRPSLASSTEDIILQGERRRLLWRAVEQLPDGCRSLVRLLLGDPEPSYAEIAASLGIPVNSIGPRRQRCLSNLRTRARQL